MQIVNIALRNMSPLPRLFLVLSVVLGWALPALAEKPRFATVDVSTVFEAYHKTAAAKSTVKTARAKLAKDPRREVLKLLRVEVKDLGDKAKDPTLSQGQRKEYYRRFMMKNYEMVSLRREREENVTEQMKQINEGMVKRTYELLGEIRAIVQKIGAEKGFDYVFEVSGKTSSQLTPLIYIRDASDITDLVIVALNKDSSPETKVAAAPNP